MRGLRLALQAVVGGARIVARVLLVAMLVGSVALSVLSALRIARDPSLRALRVATADEIVAATDRMMADVQPGEILSRIEARLDEEPRNWVALDALAGVAAERGLVLPARFAVLRDEDFGVMAQAADCLACSWDIGACTLSTVMICKVPLLLTPIEDLRGLAKGGVDWIGGGDVDEVDVALSALGLGATALVLASGGSSVSVKAGTALVKAARGMRLISPRLMAFVTDSLRAGVDVGAFLRTGDTRLALRMDVLAPVTRLVGDLGRLRGAVGTPGALHLIRLVDDGDEARRVADAAVALGGKAVGRAEVLGKARLLRATLRVGETAWAALAGLVGLMLSVASALAGMVQTAVLRGLRRMAR